MKTPSAPPQKPAAPPPPPLVNTGEVLHSETHRPLTAQEIAKAVARHNREHREQPPGKHK